MRVSSGSRPMLSFSCFSSERALLGLVCASESAVRRTRGYRCSLHEQKYREVKNKIRVSIVVFMGVVSDVWGKDKTKRKHGMGACFHFCEFCEFFRADGGRAVWRWGKPYSAMAMTAVLLSFSLPILQATGMFSSFNSYTLCFVSLSYALCDSFQRA